MVEVVPERLRERLVGDAEALLTSAEQDECGLLMEVFDDLGHQPGLADARFAGQKARPSRAGSRVIPRSEEPGPLRVSADKGELVAAKEGRGQWSGGADRLPEDLVRRQRRRKPLQVEVTDGDRAHAGTASRQRPHRVAAKDLVALGGTAQPCRLDHRQAVDIVRVDMHIADRETDADVEPGRADRASFRVDRALQSHSTFDRTSRTLEYGHDPVAEALYDRAIARDDGPAKQLVEGLTQPVGGGVTDRCPPGRRPHDIREQDGKEPGLGHGPSYDGDQVETTRSLLITPRREIGRRLTRCL